MARRRLVEEGDAADNLLPVHKVPCALDGIRG